jgi:hypothetical protein
MQVNQKAYTCKFQIIIYLMNHVSAEALTTGRVIPSVY